LVHATPIAVMAVAARTRRIMAGSEKREVEVAHWIMDRLALQ
jgi:hypothetical protein